MTLFASALYFFINQGGVVRGVGKFYDNLGVRKLAVGLIFGGFLSSAYALAPYAPNPITRPLQKSISVKGKWSDSVRFIANRGPNAIDLRQMNDQILNPETIRKLEGFKSFKESRIDIIGYELRSKEVLDRIFELLKLGANVRILVDASNVNEVIRPSDQTWKSWTPNQRIKFIKAYDSDGDGIVGDRDLALANWENRLSRRVWEILQSRQKDFPQQLELTTPPYEVVPATDAFNYPRLQHIKKISVQFKDKKGNWMGPAISKVGSDNPTDSCTGKRVEPSTKNIEAYLRGDPYQVVESSEGHIQFGAVVKGPQVTASIDGPLEGWMQLYKLGRHFNDLPPSEEQNARILFEDGSTLQSYFSEGEGKPGLSTIDPVWAISRILSRRDIQLEALYGAQFVFTHTALARLFRSLLVINHPKEFGLFVDGSQALAEYSSLPALQFAPSLRLGKEVFEGRTFENFPSVPPELAPQKNIHVYRGDVGLKSERMIDKTHAKVWYFRYNDGGVKHYVVVWGSANASSNAGKLNADALHVLDTTDPKIEEQVLPFFQSLSSDSRMVHYGQAFVEQMLTDHFFASERAFPENFLERLQEGLVSGLKTKDLLKFVERLEEVGARTAQGKLLLKIFKWQLIYGGKLDYAELWTALQFTSPEKKLTEVNIKDLKSRWLSQLDDSKKMEDAKRAWKSIEKDLMEKLTQPSDTADKKAPKTILEKSKEMVRQDCIRFLKIARGLADVQIEKFPIVKVRVR